jgi:hypothetical protein
MTRLGGANLWRLMSPAINISGCLEPYEYRTYLSSSARQNTKPWNLLASPQNITILRHLAPLLDLLFALVFILLHLL